MSMKREKGFTLVELLAVIAILGVVLLIAIPLLINNIDNKKIDASDKVKELIITAARTYVIDNEIETPIVIPISNLCSYIDCPVIDPYTNEEITGGVSVDEDLNYTLVD